MEQKENANADCLQRLVGLPLRDIAKEIDSLIDELDKHHRLAADVRELLHNGGAGPNPSRLNRADKILMEIAGLPTEQPNEPSSGTAAEWDVENESDKQIS
jgi:hypothetical protein